MYAFLSLGFLIGIAHAFEADHMAAVSSLASGRTSKCGMMRLGAAWGLGHTISLVLVGGAVILSGHAISDAFSHGLEALVGVMLVGLGGHLLFRLYRDKVHVHRHMHSDGTSHFHLHSHSGEAHPHDSQRHRHSHPDHAARRSLLVGLVHGLAGSAVLVLGVAATSSSALAGLFYILAFGIGSIFGMAAMSLAISLPLAFTARLLTRTNAALQALIGLATIAIGASTLVLSARALIG